MTNYSSNKEETAFQYFNNVVKPRPLNNREEFVYEVFLPKLLGKLGESSRLAEVKAKVRKDDTAKFYAEEVADATFFDPLFDQIMLKDEHEKSVRAISEEVTHSMTATPLLSNTLKYLALSPVYTAIEYMASRNKQISKIFCKTDDTDSVKEIAEAHKKLHSNYKNLAKMTLKSFFNRKMPQAMIRNVSGRLGISQNDAHSILAEYFGRVGYLMGGNVMEEVKKAAAPEYSDSVDYFYSNYKKEVPSTPFLPIKGIKRKMRDIKTQYQERTKEVNDIESKIEERIECIKNELKERYSDSLPDELRKAVRKALHDDKRYNEYYQLLKEKTKKYDSFEEYRNNISEKSLKAFDLEGDARWLEIDIKKDLGHGIGYLTAYRAFNNHGEEAFNIKKGELIELIEDTYKRAKKAQDIVNERTIPRIKEEVNFVLPLAKSLENIFSEFGIKYRMLASNDIKEEHVEKIKEIIESNFYSKSVKTYNKATISQAAAA